MFLNKPETGIILMKNLKAGAEPMKMLEKTRIMTVPQAKVGKKLSLIRTSISKSN